MRDSSTWSNGMSILNLGCVYSRSDSIPKYRIILKNQTDTGEGDFVQSLDDNIRFEVKEGTIFYQYAYSIFVCDSF